MKSILITGGTKGIGASIARKYLEKGYKVIVNYANSDEDAETFKKNNYEFNKNLVVVKSDLSTLDGLENLVTNINSMNTNIDIVVLNAGITKRENFEEITYESWNKVMDTNMNIPFFLIQKLNNKINENGRIIFIGSILGMRADGMSIQYGVSKGSLIPLTKYLAKYFASRNITVNCITPGFVDTPWQISKPSDQRRRIEDKTLFKRFGKTEEIANMCVTIEENAYLTGQAIIIDGGYSL